MNVVEGRYFDRVIEKADYLKDYRQTVKAIKRLMSDTDRTRRVFLSRKDENSEHYAYLKRYSNLQEMINKFDENEFDEVNDIDILIIRKDKTAKSVHMHRDSLITVILREKDLRNY